MAGCLQLRRGRHGQMTVIAVVPRRSWIWMLPAGVWSGRAGSVTATNSELSDFIATVLSRASCRQRCTTLALMPCAIAIFATDAPGSSHSASTRAFASAPYRRLIAVLSLPIVSTYSYVDTILAGTEARFKMRSPGPYD